MRFDLEFKNDSLTHCGFVQESEWPPRGGERRHRGLVQVILVQKKNRLITKICEKVYSVSSSFLRILSGLSWIFAAASARLRFFSSSIRFLGSIGFPFLKTGFPLLPTG